MRCVLIGAAGQLGRDLAPRLPGEVVPLTRPEADLTRPAELARRLADLRPDVILNCAAYNFVDPAEREPDAAFAVNAWGVRELARTAQRLGVRLVHVSSDYVFGLDPDRDRPYSADDPPGPVSVYGLSKLTGEYLVRAECERHLIVRTCGLYGVWGSGGKGGNFVETMLKRAGAGQPLRVVADQVCTPSYTADVAGAIARMVAAGATGLHHVTNSGSCTWHEFAAAIFALSGATADLTPITSAEFGAAARRPRYSVLAATDEPLRPWREALADYLRERKSQKMGSQSS